MSKASSRQIKLDASNLDPPVSMSKPSALTDPSRKLATCLYEPSDIVSWRREVLGATLLWSISELPPRLARPLGELARFSERPSSSSSQWLEDRSGNRLQLE